MRWTSPAPGHGSARASRRSAERNSATSSTASCARVGGPAAAKPPPGCCASPLFVVGAQADLLERSPIGPKPVSRDLGESETLLLEQLAHELPSGGFVAPVLDQDVQHLTLIVNRPPQVHVPAANPQPLHPNARAGWILGRSRRRFRAIAAPNFSTHWGTVSYVMSRPRLASRSSTSR
jgi:hypothetical protein